MQTLLAAATGELRRTDDPVDVSGLLSMTGAPEQRA